MTFFLARRKLNLCVTFISIGIRFVIIIIFVPAQGPPVDQGPKPGWRHLPKHLNTHQPPKSQQNKFCAPVLMSRVLVQCFDISLSSWMGGFVGGPLSMMAVCESVHFDCKYLVKTGSRPSYDLDEGWREESLGEWNLTLGEIELGVILWVFFATVYFRNSLNDHTCHCLVMLISLILCAPDWQIFSNDVLHMANIHSFAISVQSLCGHSCGLSLSKVLSSIMPLLVIIIFWRSMSNSALCGDQSEVISE